MVNLTYEKPGLYTSESIIYFPFYRFAWLPGISKHWDNSALAYAEQGVIFQATTRFHGRVHHYGNSEQNWKQDQYLL